MPELPEVEAYRALAERVIGRTVGSVVAPDDWFLKRGLTAPAVRKALKGVRFTGARRIGKLLLLDTEGGPVLGLRFGMTGRLLVDGTAGIEGMLYSSDRDERSWDRFALTFADGGDLRIRDPRRLGGVELDPDETRLGVDVLDLTPARLRHALGTSITPLKARLMDQSRIAGIGNLMADESLWRAGLLPSRRTDSLSAAEVRRLATHLVGTTRDLISRGGSHRGDVIAHRSAGGMCPRDGRPLSRATVGGRTTWWCPHHQH